MSDSISNLITRIRNAYLAKHQDVRLPATKQTQAVAQVLVEGGYLEAAVREEKMPQDELVLTLRYVNSKPAMTGVKRVSKPGRRIYATVEKLPRVLSGYGASVISTSQGIMTDKEARLKKVGGEVLFQIW